MNKIKQQWLLIALIYAISNIFLLLNQGIYWDDWLLYKISYEGINKEFVRNGSWYLTPIHFFLQNVTNYPVLLYHALTFALGLISTVVFYNILKKFKLEQNHIFILTLFFAVSPYYQAKQTMICLGYTIGFFLFLLGTLTFLISISRKNIYLRIISLLTLFLSFAFLNSVLVMWLAFILLYIIYKQKKVEFSFFYLKKIVHQMLAWLDFVILPFVFWINRHFFFQPVEWLAAQGYNQLTLKGLILTPFNVILAVLVNTFGLVSESFRPIMESQSYGVLFVLLLTIMYYLSYKLKIFQLDCNVNKAFLYIGIYFFIAGIFPYAVVEKNPSFSGFATRGQVLLPIGMSFILLYSISLFRHTKVKQIVFILMISLFIISNVSSQVKYTKSWFKQESLIKHIKEKCLLVPHNNYLLFDRTTDYDENERGLSHWALSSMITKTLDAENCFMIEISDKSMYRPDMEFQYYFLLEKGEFVLKTKTVLLLLYQYYFNKERFSKNVYDILECRVGNLDKKLSK